MSKRDSSMGVQQGVIRWTVITIIVALALYLVFVILANASEVAHAVKQLPHSWLAFVLILSLASYGVRALRWNYYLVRLGVQLNHRIMLLLYFAGLSMLITPAMISGVVKVGLVKVREGAELTRTLPIVVVERLTDLIAMLVLAMFGILFFQLGYPSIIGTVIFLVIVISFLKIEWCRERVLDVLEKVPGLKHHVESIRKLFHSANTLLDTEALVVGSFFGFISWGLAGFAMFVLVQGFGIDLSLGETLFIMAFPAILGVMSQLPGGIGLEEGTMVSLLVRKDVEFAEATALVLLFRLATLWFGLTIGLASLGMFTHHIYPLGDDDEDSITPFYPGTTGEGGSAGSSDDDNESDLSMDEGGS